MKENMIKQVGEDAVKFFEHYKELKSDYADWRMLQEKLANDHQLFYGTFPIIAMFTIQQGEYDVASIERILKMRWDADLSRRMTRDDMLAETIMYLDMTHRKLHPKQSSAYYHEYTRKMKEAVAKTASDLSKTHDMEKMYERM